MKKLFMVFALVLLVCGATLGAMKWFGLGPFEQPKMTKTEEGPPEIKAPDALFIDMAPVMINVMQSSSILTTIQLELKIETAGQDNIIKIKRMLPIYRDAFVKDLHSFVPRMLSELERLDLPTLKQRMQLVADKVAGETDIVRGVLIQSILDTPQ